MKCILCLKEFGHNSNPHLLIFSIKGEQLSARHIIEKHFWMQTDESNVDKCLICRFCWKTLHSFHKFYIRIENAHKSLKKTHEFNGIRNETAEVVYCPSIINSMKEEETVDNTTMTIPEFNSFTQPEANICATPLHQEFLEEFVSENKPNECDTVLDEHNALQTDIEPLSLVPKTCTSKRKRGRPKKCGTAKALEKETASNNGITNDCSAINSNLKSNKRPKVRAKSLEFDEVIAKNFKLLCCLCQTTCSNFSNLKTHFRVEHNTKGYVKCCGKKLLKRGLLVDHIFTHQNPNYFTCTKCSKVMSTRRSLELHVKQHESDRARIHQCAVCKKSYFSRVVYLRHLQLHASEEEKTIPCPQCPKTFPTKYYMTQHLKLVHLNMYAKVCDICGKSIRGSEAFQRHQQQHKGLKPQPLECKICGLALTTKYGLARHIKVRHTEKYTQSQKCSICSKISPSLMAHNFHMKYVHSMERKHDCTLCDKAFKRPKDLKEHMTTHTGEVLYTCTHCPKTFNSNANMYAHRKRSHPKEWEECRRKRLKDAQFTNFVAENHTNINNKNA